MSWDMKMQCLLIVIHLQGEEMETTQRLQTPILQTSGLQTSQNTPVSVLPNSLCGGFSDVPRLDTFVKAGTLIQMRGSEKDFGRVSCANSVGSALSSIGDCSWEPTRSQQRINPAWDSKRGKGELHLPGDLDYGICFGLQRIDVTSWHNRITTVLPHLCIAIIHHTYKLISSAVHASPHQKTTTPQAKPHRCIPIW